MNSDASIKESPTTPDADKPGSLFEHGYGFDTSTTYFFTENIATELSLGASFFKIKSSALEKISVAFGNGKGAPGKNNNIIFVPLAATLQYHIAPFGAIRPYIGAGYHGSYLYTRSKTIKVRPGHGLVLQAGVDFLAKDNTLLTFDVRQYFLKSKVTFKKDFLSPNPAVTDPAPKNFDSNVTFNPLIVSVGIGFKF